MIKARSFKSRLMIAASALIAMVLVLVLYARVLVNESTHQSVDNLHSMGKLNQYLAQLKTTLQDTERLAYQQAVNPDANLHDRFQAKVLELEKIDVALNRYIETRIMANTAPSISVDNLGRMQFLASSITEQTHKIEHVGNRYFTISSNLDQRVPGMHILTDKLLPKNNLFIQSTELAIVESNFSGDEPVQNEIRDLFQNLRYVWSQQVSWVRLFIANRAGVFGEAKHSMDLSLENRQLYFRQAEAYIDRLSQLEKNHQLDIQQIQSYKDIQKIVSDYEKDFKLAKAIYLSDNWRADLQLFKTDLRPLFKVTWDNIRAFEVALGNYAGTTINLSQGVAGQSKNLIWISGAISLLMILVTYILFDRIVRLPILQISKALDAEAAGKEATISMHKPVEETSLLINAFRNMQDQVHQRQTRLESILDNAAEGIVTINDKGLIESFNSAAQELFGYRFDEVVGKNIDILVPGLYKSLTKLHAYDDQTARPGTIVNREVSVEKKNGSKFTLSLKVSEMFLNGHRHFTAVVEDITDRKALIQNLRNLAEHDSLTGLYNRLYFTEELERIMGKLLRGDQNAMALLYIDLDNFKYVNDTMGHLAGDQLLVEVASILKANTRDTDLLARLGGDEFAVILFRPEPAHIVEAAERFRHAIQEYHFVCEGNLVNIACSIGLAVIDDSVKGKDQILSRADIACAEAKKRGRNIVYMFTEDDQNKISTMSSDIGWASTIKQSIANEHFILAGQPIVSIESGDIDFVELLLRLRNDDNDLIMPSGFIPSAERFGLMADIDRWVIKHALALLAQMQASDDRLHFSINLSANLIDDSNLIQFINQQFEYYNISPERLLFEVTESVAIANLQNASTVLRQLQQFGCATALDDFGVGYSSFTYLKELPVDYVKIDGSFVRNIDKDELNLAFVRSINDIAHAMGKKTIAEFVETRTCLQRLKEIGVDYAQGFFLGKPELFDEKLHNEALQIKQQVS